MLFFILIRYVSILLKKRNYIINNWIIWYREVGKLRLRSWEIIRDMLGIRRRILLLSCFGRLLRSLIKKLRVICWCLWLRVPGPVFWGFRLWVLPLLFSKRKINSHYPFLIHAPIFLSCQTTRTFRSWNRN